MSERPIVTITERRDDAGHHLGLRGRLDVRTVPDVRLTVHRVVDDGREPLLLDLGELVVGDATGFGLLVECLRRSRRHGRVLLVTAADDRTERLFRRARLASVLALGRGLAPARDTGERAAAAG